ncbi:uncharacterized protein PV09_02677 [Verruconis gallopava]|uniref:Polyprenal reductase n=1 Tax=Verruconis gallopava TaxID=253628 RepID=A0A0D2B4N6_9PEZI|nr:uncharacterized protein PV09_02677 [Verruconis gallopava]KIW06199.1 hypothetical protein PV09_02677 [Verruconis gallopava]
MADVGLDVVLAIRSFYLLVAAAIIGIYAIPPFKSRFLAYGARAAPSSMPKNGLLDHLAAVTVPHAWFKHFYILSIAACLFWLGVILTQNPILDRVLSFSKEPEVPVSAMQVSIAWFALILHSVRRYLECLEAAPSSSRMFVGHWVMGLLFYVVTSVAVWIEGDRRLIKHTVNEETGDSDWILLLVSPDISYGKQLLIVLGVGIFFLASVTQGNVHGYFRDLKQLTKGKYTLPQHPLFDYTVTPHYAAECFEYLGLALILAPKGRVFNTTMLCCLVFVVVNLGVTADGTREWYKEKFPKDKIEKKSRMIPFIW